MWTKYMDNFESMRISIDIPVNSKDYITKILEFDKAFINNGAKYGIYYFIPKEMIQKGLSEQYLNLYLKHKTNILTSNNYEYITLLNLEPWLCQLNRKEVDYFFEMTDIPTLENGNWIKKGIPLDKKRYPING